MPSLTPYVTAIIPLLFGIADTAAQQLAPASEPIPSLRRAPGK
jgi:hypothetical protein